MRTQASACRECRPQGRRASASPSDMLASDAVTGGAGHKFHILRPSRSFQAHKDSPLASRPMHEVRRQATARQSRLGQHRYAAL